LVKSYLTDRPYQRQVIAMTPPPLDSFAKPKLPPLRHTLLGAAAHLVPIRPGAVAAALRQAPRGDGHPVIVVPSFLRGDGHTAALRRFLSGCGYAVTGWGLGTNLGPTAAALAGIEVLLAATEQRHGRRVTLVGHSLGGVIARELAKQHPHSVRQLVLLASPIRLPTASPIEPVYRLLARWHNIDAIGAAAQLNAPPEVPVTAIYTRSDGIVAWETCREIEGAMRESVEVRGAHGTMVRNRAAWRIIADRLAQPEGEWRPYRS
jgi:pimeloyl-ACP methyl ester carboxylesterase